MKNYTSFTTKTFIVISLIITTACTEADIRPGSRIIEEELQPYLNTFLAEAEARGLKIDVSLLTMNFNHDTPKSDAAANLNTYTITIDSTSYDWKMGYREQLVFHELGHLFLKRDHDDSMIGYYPKSIMAGKLDPWYESRNAPAGMREYYINELFDPNTPRPDWSYE